MAEVQRRGTDPTQNQIGNCLGRGTAGFAVEKNSLATSRPNYALLAVRRNSFNCLQVWEVSRSGCNPSMLAEAGIYYEVINGLGYYRCFRCPLKETSWPFQEDPFKEHKKKSSNCPHIREELANREKQLTKNTVLSNNDGSETNENVNDREDPTIHRLEADGVACGVLTTTSTPLMSKLNPASKDQISSRNLNQSNTERELLKQNIKRLINSCRQCRKAKIETLFLPCRHLVTCEECADKMVDCIICQTEILGTARVYFG